MRLTKLTNPQTLPVSLDAIKHHVAIDLSESGYDPLLTDLIRSAAEWVESETHVTLIATQLRAVWPEPPAEVVKLPAWPVSAVESITYLDTAGASQTLSAANYRTELVQCPATVRPGISLDWPDTLVDSIVGFTVNMTAGYASAAVVPHAFRHLIKLLVGHWFKHREGVLVGATSKEIELAVESLRNITRVNEFEEFLVQ